MPGLSPRSRPILALAGALVAAALALACAENPTTAPGFPSGTTPRAIPSFTAPPASPQPTGSPTAQSSAEAGATVTASGGSVSLEAHDNFFAVNGTGADGKPVVVTSPAGPLTIQLTNKGAAIHNIHVTGAVNKSIDLVQAGETKTVDLGSLSAGTYDFVCDFHPGAMIGHIVVQ